MPARKWCFVPGCKNTTKRTPEKTFITVPKDAKKRQKWFAVARRDIAEVSEKSTLYCCEDHFNVSFSVLTYSPGNNIFTLYYSWKKIWTTTLSTN